MLFFNGLDIILQVEGKRVPSWIGLRGSKLPSDQPKASPISMKIVRSATLSLSLSIKYKF